ncbi:MAG: hypothetical protein S0880_27270 [Actinomycetota bacterium]|nr:hypothetical protein [Actinomycetota bacterium]
MDVLDDNGLLGWQHGLLLVRRAVAEVGPDETCDTAACPDHRRLADLGRWLDEERRAEEVRWRSPATLLRTFRLVVQAGDHRDPRVLARWADNLDAATHRQALLGPAPKQLQRHLDALTHQLPATAEGERCRRSIDELRPALSARGGEPPRVPMTEPARRFGLVRWLRQGGACGG